MSHTLSLSVAMCTYNGGRYVQAQLHSIAAQTRPPDELIICDDGSEDDKYRQHARQQIGGRRQTMARTLAQRLSVMRADFAAYSTQGHANCAAALTHFAQAHERLLTKGNLPQDSRALAALRAKIAHFRARAELPRHRWARLPIIARELLGGSYQRYSRGLFSAAQDLVR